MLIRGIGDRTEHYALVEPEQVGSAEDDTQRAPSRPRFADLESALQNRELSDEAVEQGHAERTEADDEIHGGKVGHRRREAAKIGNHARVAPLVKNADDQEECAGGDAVIDLLKHAAGEAIGRERKNSQRAKTKMADGTVGD